VSALCWQIDCHASAAEIEPRIAYAFSVKPEAQIMSDQDDWDFAGANDAKAEIPRHGGYLLRGVAAMIERILNPLPSNVGTLGERHSRHP